MSAFGRLFGGITKDERVRMHVPEMDLDGTVHHHNITVRTGCIDHRALVENLKRCNRMIDLRQRRGCFRTALPEICKG